MRSLLIGCSVVWLLPCCLCLGLFLWFFAVHVPLACEQLNANPLFNAPYGQMTQNEIRAWITQQYGVEDASVSHYANGPDYRWEQDGIKYRVEFPSGDFTRATLTFDPTRTPTGQEILDCFGTPDNYQSRYFGFEGTQQDLTFWYDDIYMMVDITKGYYPWTAKEPMRSDERISEIVISTPDRYKTGLGLWREELPMQQWESWEAIVIEGVERMK